MQAGRKGGPLGLAQSPDLFSGHHTFKNTYIPCACHEANCLFTCPRAGFVARTTRRPKT